MLLVTTSLIIIIIIILLASTATNNVVAVDEISWINDRDNQINDKSYSSEKNNINEISLNDMLFPDKSNKLTIQETENNLLRRSLSFDNLPYTTKVKCQLCTGLKSCAILNNYLIQEVYYPLGNSFDKTYIYICFFNNILCYDVITALSSISHAFTYINIYVCVCILSLE